MIVLLESKSSFKNQTQPKHPKKTVFEINIFQALKSKQKKKKNNMYLHMIF